MEPAASRQGWRARKRDSVRVFGRLATFRPGISFPYPDPYSHPRLAVGGTAGIPCWGITQKPATDSFPFASSPGPGSLPGAVDRRSMFQCLAILAGFE